MSFIIEDYHDYRGHRRELEHQQFLENLRMQEQSIAQMQVTWSHRQEVKRLQEMIQHLRAHCDQLEQQLALERAKFR